MSITLVEFDRSVYDTEKCSLQIGTTVYNVSEGIYGQAYYERRISQSPLYSSLSLDAYRSLLWNEIKLNLAKYKANPVEYMRNTPGGEFKVLMIIIENLKKHGRIKLLYISNRPQAELIARCLEYLVTVV